MSIAILGAGAFGTALAIALANDGRDVRLWSRDFEKAAAIQRARVNAAKLQGIRLPDLILVTSDLADLAGASALLLAVPAQQSGALLKAHSAAFPDAPIVCCAKGIEQGSQKLQSQVVAAHLPKARIAALTGPGFAAEIAAGLPTALTLACVSPDTGVAMQSLLSTPRLRLYLTRDIRGAQLGGALKNVIALACGMSAGAGLGESARAALMTRGFAEMNRLALALGAHPETLTGLSGLGDLALTCTSVQSRNFASGHALGAGKTANANATVEGIATAHAACALAKSNNVDLPIANAVAAVLSARITIPQAMELLLTRPLRSEQGESTQ